MTTEATFSPDWFSKPGDTIRSQMRRRGVAAGDLASQLEGGWATLRGLLDGSVAIDARHATSLGAAVGGTPSFWLQRQERYKVALDRAIERASLAEGDEWLGLPVPGPRPRGALTDARRRDEVGRRLAFFNVGTMAAWHARYGQLMANVRFRASRAFPADQGATLMWLRSGEMAADLVTTRPWSPDELRARLPAIRALTRIAQPSRFLPRLAELGSEAGVAVVVQEAPAGCRASGAVRMIAPDKVVLLLSLRHRSDDHFWFTVFHEVGHLLLHGAQTFVDGEDTTDDEREREANDFASRCIVPPEREAELRALGDDATAVIRLSVSLGISPGLTVGQLQHRGLLPRERLNRLKRRWALAEFAVPGR